MGSKQLWATGYVSLDSLAIFLPFFTVQAIKHILAGHTLNDCSVELLNQLNTVIYFGLVYPKGLDFGEEPLYTPTRVKGLPAGGTSLACGQHHTLVLTAAGTFSLNSVFLFFLAHLRLLI